MNSPRIALISGDYPPAISGIGDYVEKLAGAMSKLGANVTVLTSAADMKDDAPYEIRRVMPSWKWKDRGQLLDLISDFDIAHIQYPSTAYGRSMMINVLPSLIRRKCPNTKSLVTIHDFRVMRWRWRARTAPMLFGIDGLIHVDPRDGPFLDSWMPLGKPPTAIIPIAANAEPVPCTPADRMRWRKQLGFADDETVVAFFGIFYPHKGLPELHAAVRALRAAGKKVRLLALGDFDRTAEWRAGMESELRGEHCVWVQGAALDRVSECLHAADVAALPFHSGASTNRGSLLATLAHGLPTITTRGPATPADFEKTFDVSLVPIQSTDALRLSIEQLMNDSTLQHRMRSAALAAMAPLSWPVVSKQTLAFYDQLLVPKTVKAVDKVAA